MKTTLLVCASLFLFIISSSAQIKKGSILLGGDLSANTISTKSAGTTSKQSGINVYPVFGKAIRDNLVFGGNLSLGFNNSENTGGSRAKFQQYGAGVFLRKYRAIGSSGFYIFFQGGLSGSFSKQVNKDLSVPSAIDETKGFGASVSVYPGISYAISKKLHLETGFNNLLTLSYLHQKRQYGDPVQYITKTNTFNFSSSLNNFNSGLYLGFRFLISKS